MNSAIEQLDFYLTAEHECSYLPDRQAVTLFADPHALLTNQQYTQLARLGFRRSGTHLYRPHCDDCGYCIPVRVPIATFKPNRSQRRNLKKNQLITLHRLAAEYSEEHFNLYRRYMQARHPGGGMDNDDAEAYCRMLNAEWSHSELLEFRRNGQLVGVAIIDFIENGLSAVDTYFDPDAQYHGLGVYAILRQIQLCRELEIAHLYLGYWNPHTPKMAYKVNYQPIEFFDGQAWQILQKSAESV